MPLRLMPAAVTPTRDRNSPPAGIWSAKGLLGSLATAFLLALPASAAEVRTGISEEPISLPSPGSPDWQPLLFRSIENPTDYQPEFDPDGRPAFRAVSDCGASAMRLKLPDDLDLAATPRLAWRWRIERGLGHRGEKTKAGDDFAARVYVLFEFDAEKASFMDRMQRKLGRQLFGVDLPGKTINYVWTGLVPVGEKWTSPHHADARLVSVASDSGGEGHRGGAWRETVVDLADDAKRLFTPALEQRPYALALMVDADDQCQTAIAWFSDFRLLGPGPEGPMGGSASDVIGVRNGIP